MLGHVVRAHMNTTFPNNSRRAVSNDSLPLIGGVGEGGWGPVDVLAASLWVPDNSLE